MVYVNKMLAMAAENNYTGFKSLNSKYFLSQINRKDSRGNTPLLYASRHRNIEFINHLLNIGADPSIPGEKGKLTLIQTSLLSTISSAPMTLHSSSGA